MKYKHNAKYDKRVEEIMAGMTVEDLVGQLFVCRRPQDDAVAMEAVTRYRLGGFTLYACDFEHETPDSMRALTARYQNAASIPLFFAVDEEGGRVSRAGKFPAFRSEPFPNPRTLFAGGGYEAVDRDTREKAAMLRDLGVNFNYAPVLDMSGNPETFIFDRTFGDDPAATAKYARTVVTAMNDCRLIGSIKHFPGYGDNVDTHRLVAHDDRSMEQFMSRDLKPFRAGIAAGVPVVMVAHNIVSCMDPDRPASLSPAVHKLLREDLGFEGLIITDSLDMNAIVQYTHEKAAAVEAVLSGNDLLCCSSYDKQVPGLLEAVADGTISLDRIKESVRKVLELKLRMGIIPEKAVRPAVPADVANLPLKIVHDFPHRADDTLRERRASITRYLNMLKRKGFGGIVTNVSTAHEYLENEREWKLFAFTADECERLGMRMWIYDENGYPSGSAGGITLRDDPELEALAVVVVKETVAPGETKTIPLPRGHMRFLYAGLYPCGADGQPLPDAEGRCIPLPGPDFRNETEAVTLTNTSDAPAVLCAFVEKRLYEGTHCIHNVFMAQRYIDVTNRDAVAAFIRNTYEKYFEAVPGHMTAGAGAQTPVPGKIEAFFTDEPSFMGCYINAGLWPGRTRDPYDTEIPLYPVLSYGRDVENQFAARYGYDLRSELVSVFLGDSDHARAVRSDYYALMSDLYEDSFFAQLGDWCGRHDISFSGHILLEDDIRHHTIFEGDYFRLLRHMHTPGIDMLQSLPRVLREYAFTPKLVSSVAHAYSRPHVMSEVSAHAQGGHVTHDQMYASLCAQYAMGVDTFTYYYGTEFMDDATYTAYNGALGRIDRIMAGRHLSNVLLYYPIETFRQYHKPSDAQYGSYTAEENACKAGVDAVMDALLDRQCDFDFVGFDVLSRCAVKDGLLTTPGGETVQALVLPPMSVTPQMQALFDRLSASGVPVLTTASEVFAPAAGARVLPDAASLVDVLDQDKLLLRTGRPAPYVLALTRDTFAGTRATLLCNTAEADNEVTVTLSGMKAPVLYDPLADAVLPCAFVKDGDGLRATVKLPCNRSYIIMERVSGV
ncbi:MAG: hypothetical protein MJ192_02510 [Clostridia bacterium]|nr:hypothetical protein [Clostridia bacterium]